MNPKLLKWAFAVMLLVFTLPSFAQKTPVTGRVLNKQSGEVLAGATVTVKGTNVSAVSNSKGQFTIEAQPGSVLVISYAGMTQQELALTGQTSDLVVKLDESAETTLSNITDCP